MENSKFSNLTIMDWKNGPTEKPKKYIENSAQVIAAMRKDWENKWDGEQDKYKKKFMSEYSSALQKPNEEKNIFEDKITKKFNFVKHVAEDKNEFDWKINFFDSKEKINEEKIIEVPAATKSQNNETQIKNQTTLETSISNKVTNGEIKKEMLDTVMIEKKDETIKTIPPIQNNIETLDFDDQTMKKILEELKKIPGLPPMKSFLQQKLPSGGVLSSFPEKSENEKFDEALNSQIYNAVKPYLPEWSKPILNTIEKYVDWKGPGKEKITALIKDIRAGNLESSKKLGKDVLNSFGRTLVPVGEVFSKIGQKQSLTPFSPRPGF